MAFAKRKAVVSGISVGKVTERPGNCTLLRELIAIATITRIRVMEQQPLLTILVVKARVKCFTTF